MMMMMMIINIIINSFSRPRSRPPREQTIVAMFDPFSQFCEIYFPSEPVATARNNPQSISGGDRTWQERKPYSTARDESNV